jgi:asparagine N-glycosylation enzyme membrane subunit Stt3
MNRRIRGAAAVGLAAAAGVALRLSVTFTGSPDCLYHLRRAFFAVRQFPRTVIFDPLVNWPRGGICIWPPLFDLALALPARIAFGPRATLSQLVRTAQPVPILFAAAAIAAAALAGRVLERRWGAAAAAWLVAICPGHLEYSQLGHTDQHVAESLWGFAAFGFFLWACRRNRPSLELLAGLALTLAVLTWQGAIFWAAIFAGGLAMSALHGDGHALLRKAVLVLGVPAAIAGGATAFWSAGRALPFTYVSFGPFQPVFLSAAFSAVCLVLFVVEARRGGGRGRRAIAAAAGFIAGAAAPAARGAQFLAATAMGAAHLVSRSRGGAISAGGLLSYSREWLSQIVEYRPLLSDGVAWPVEYLGLGFFLAPLAIVLWARRARLRGRAAVFATLALWGAFTFVWTISQRRNVYYAALLSALATVEIARWLSVWLARRGVARAPLAAALAGLILAAPMFPGLSRVLRSGYEPPPEQLEAMASLAAIARSPLDPYDPRIASPGAAPSVAGVPGVLGFWSQGHAIEFLAGLPAVADNFGYGYFDCLRFFFAETESEGLEILRRDRVRYVETMDLLPLMEQYGRSLGRRGYSRLDGNRIVPLPRYRRTLQARLQDGDGEGLSHFRLLFASAPSARGGRRAPRFKIFEVIP